MTKPPQTNPGFNAAGRRKARHYALQALYQWYMTAYSLNEIESQFLTDYDFSVVDREYFHDLVHGVPAALGDIETAFAPFLIERGIDELDPIERAVLRLGSYELLKRIDIPYKVVINEAVSLAKKFGAEDGHKYINGVLDKLARDVRKIEIDAQKKSG